MKSTHLYQPAFTLLVVVIIFLAFLDYGVLLLDWVQAYRTGVYVHQLVAAVCKIAAHLLHLLAGVRFLTNRINIP